MMQLKKYMEIYDRVLACLFSISGGILMFSMLAICFDVIARFLFNKPQIWVMEFTEYGLLYLTFLGAAWVLKVDGHVKVDILTCRLKPKTAEYFNIITSILGVLICLVLTLYGFLTTVDHFFRGIVTSGFINVPNYLIIAVIPAGFLLLSIEFARKVYHQVKR